MCLSCGTFGLIYDLDKDTLWLGADGKTKEKESFEISGPLELFGFGSGDYAEGPEATDIMSDVQSRWLCFRIASEREEMILEADKRLPEHIRKSDISGRVLQLHVASCELYLFQVLVF